LLREVRGREASWRVMSWLGGGALSPLSKEISAAHIMLLDGTGGLLPGSLSTRGLGIAHETRIVHTQVDLSEKEKAAASAVLWRLETRGSLLR
jgi:hypothetical protein